MINPEQLLKAIELARHDQLSEQWFGNPFRQLPNVEKDAVLHMMELQDTIIDLAAKLGRTESGIVDAVGILMDGYNNPVHPSGPVAYVQLGVVGSTLRILNAYLPKGDSQ